MNRRPNGSTTVDQLIQLDYDVANISRTSSCRQDSIQTVNLCMHILLKIKCNLYRVAQKMAQFFWYAVTSSNIERFSKLFHCQNQENMCNNTQDFTHQKSLYMWINLKGRRYVSNRSQLQISFKHTEL